MSKIQTIVSFLKSKKYIAIAVLVILVFLILRAILLSNPNPELTYTVKRENLVDTVKVSGSYATASQIAVTSPANGVIDKLFVANGDHVKKGDPLFHVTSSATEDQIKTAYASYLAANSQVKAETAKLYSLQSTMFAAWKIYTDLSTNSTYEEDNGDPKTENRILPEFTTAQDDWLAAEANYKNQQAVIAKDQAALSAAKQAYDETQSVTMHATIDGTIENLLTNEGDQVTADHSSVVIAGKSSGQAKVSTSLPEPILVISNLANPYIAADISEDYAASITKGQKTEIVFDSLKKKTFAGNIADINNVANTRDGIVTYTARIQVPNLPKNIKPGMTALLTIETLRKDNVIDVPNSALITKDGISYVEQAKTHKRIPVELGVEGIAKTEIINGLSVDSIILANIQAH